MNARKEPDMKRFMNGIELNELFHAYSVVHAKKNGQMPFKKVGSTQIVRANDGAGVFFDADVILRADEAQRKQTDALSTRITENMHRIAANFLTQGITPANVPDRIYQALAVNYSLSHWTAAVVTVNNFRSHYKKIYDECFHSLEINSNKETYTDDDFLRASNAIEVNLGIRSLLGAPLINEQKEIHRRVLNTFAPNIHVRFFDSWPNGNYQKFIQESLTTIAPRMRFSTGKSSKQDIENDMTCGDHSVYTLFRVAVLNKPFTPISSKQLRQLSDIVKTEQANRMETEESEESNAVLVDGFSQSVPLTAQQYTATEKMFDIINNQASVAPNAIISENDAEIEGNNSNQSTDNDIVAHLIDVQNKTEEVLVLLKAIADYSAADLIRETLKNPSFAKEENIRKFIAVNKLSTSLIYSEKLPILLNQLANLIAGNKSSTSKKQEFSKQEKIVFAEAAKEIANNFAVNVDNEKQNALLAANKRPKPVVTTPSTTPMRPVMMTTTPTTRPTAAPTTTYTSPRDEPVNTTAATTPSQQAAPAQEERSLLYKIGMGLSVLGLIALTTTFAIAIVYAAIFTLPAIIAIGILTLAVGGAIAFVADKANSPEKNSGSAYAPSNGTYCKFSERMPLVGEYGVKHVTTPTLRKTTTADTTHTHKSSIKPFRK